MTEPKAPSFNGVKIRKDDQVTLKPLTVGTITDDGVFAASLGSARCIWVTSDDLASHTPAPRPLVPGPATFMLNPVTVKAVVDGRAWISSQGEEVILDTEDTAKLRSTEGAAS